MVLDGKFEMIRTMMNGMQVQMLWRRLTCLRGWLALYVVLHHVRNGLWPFMRDLPPDGSLWYAWNATTSVLFRFGLHAVFLFFIVSGLSIHFSTLSSLGQAFDAWTFYWRRLRRLYPALLLSLIFSALVWILGLGGSIAEQRLPLLATLTFQQGIVAPNFANNQPYWSLANEGWYYFAYPLFVWLVVQRKQSERLLLFAGLVIIVATNIAGLRQGVVAYAPVWIAGAWLGGAYFRGLCMNHIVRSICILVVMLSLFSTLKQRQIPSLDQMWFQSVYGIALVFVVDLWICCEVPNWIPGFVRTGSNVLGEISYSLYLNHFLIIEVMGHHFPRAQRCFGSAMATSVAAVCASLGVAWLSWRFVELPFLSRSTNQILVSSKNCEANA